MTRAEIEAKLGAQYTAAPYDEPIRAHFAIVMVGRTYSYEALQSAWLWFVAGWHARAAQQFIFDNTMEDPS